MSQTTNSRWEDPDPFALRHTEKFPACTSRRVQGSICRSSYYIGFDQAARFYLLCGSLSRGLRHWEQTRASYSTQN